MKILVIYDSAYGNTEQIAQAIANVFKDQNTVETLRVGATNSQKLQEAELIIAGSPTYGGRPTQPMQDFLKALPNDAVKGVKVAVFDTRLTNKMVGLFGYAAGKIADQLKSKGGTPVSTPEGFFVKGTKGPLKDGEIERATSWAKGILASLKTQAVVS